MKFSVIIPVYNVAPYLRECLDSVLRAVGKVRKPQPLNLSTSQPLVEIICVDDGSTDGCGEILEEYREKKVKIVGKGQELPTINYQLPTIRVIHQANAGVSAARNAALEVATGDWICFVDADDVVHPEYFAAVDKAIRGYETIDAVSFPRAEFTDTPKFAAVADGTVADLSRRIDFDHAERDFFQYAMRRDVVKNIRFPPYVMGEDRLYIARCLMRLGRVVDVPTPIYGYRLRDGSAVKSSRTWRKTSDDLKHSVRRFALFLFGFKRVDFTVYRRQFGIWIKRFLLWR